jgi:hypothetical protein
MAIIRQENWLGQQRVDVPHVKALESAVCGDFDVIAGMLTGGNPYVIKGFTLSGATVGQPADSLLIITASGEIIAPNASEAGSFFSVPANRAAEPLITTNAKVVGSFTPNSQNYIGVDLIRKADPTTTDIVEFNNPDTQIEMGVRVPLARTMDYQIVINTSDFSLNSSVCPIAIVTTDSANQIVSIEDSRTVMFRLGSGGSSPNPQNTWGWPGGRNETVSADAGDFSIHSFKGWMDAIMTRLFELGGGEYWYSNTADRNVRVLYSAVFSSTGEPYDTITYSGNVLWKGVSFLFDNSTGHRNDVADQLTAASGLTDLTLDGDCIYVDLDRSQNRVAGINPIVAQKGNLTTLGTSSPPGSRYVLVAKIGSYFYVRDQYLPIGSLYRVATTSVIGGVKLLATPPDSLSPYVATMTNATSKVVGAGGISREGLGSAGDLTIGGVTGNDHNVIIQTGGNSYSTYVFGYQRYSTGGVPAFEVQQYGAVGQYPDARILGLKASLDGSSSPVSKVYVDAQGAVAQANVSASPTPPDGAEIIAGLRSIKFVRPSKYWKDSVVCAYDPAVGVDINDTYTVSTHSGQKRLTSRFDNAAIVIDNYAPSNGDRVLLVTDDADAGIYVVTDQGSAGTHWILDRAPDFLTTSNVSQGFAVHVENGDMVGGQNYLLSTLDPIALETTSLFWTFTDPNISDQSCIRWGDGTVSLIVESPSYSSGG